MLRKDEIIYICNLIEERYYFNDNFNIWREVKEKIYDLLSEESYAIEDIDRCLSFMGDMHLRLLDITQPQMMNLSILEYLDGDLYVQVDNEREKIEAINNNKIQEYLFKYKERYPKFPERFLINQIIQDIKFCKGGFQREVLLIETESGNKIESKQINPKDMMEMTSRKIIDKLKTVIAVLIDADTSLVKFVTFNDEGIDIEFRKLMRNKVLQDTSTIIFDLRDNPGGKIELTKKIVSYIVPCKTKYPFFIKNKNGEVQYIEINSNQNDVFKGKKIVIFQNGNTMSSSEFIFITGLKAALGCNVTIIGEQTMGMSGQASVHKIGNEGLLYLTEKRYFTENNIEVTQGIQPDIIPDIEYGKFEDNYVSWYRLWKVKDEKILEHSSVFA